MRELLREKTKLVPSVSIVFLYNMLLVEKKNYPKSAQNSINSTDLSCICLVSDCKKKKQQMFMKASGSWVLTYLQLVQNCRHI